jgi:hypothetical protein
MEASSTASLKLKDKIGKLDRAAGTKRPSRWNSGVCSICGKWVECITQDHARLHGYKNADEMAKAGVIK